MKVSDAIGHALVKEGLQAFTGFPYNPVIDGVAAHGIRPIIARSERVAINIADGFSRLAAGRSFGVTAVQYGPGAEASFGALAQAFGDQVPMLLVTGGYDSHWAGVAPNFRAEHGFGPVTKAVLSVNYPDRAPLMVQRAMALLRGGRGGPVVLEIPDDLMKAEIEFDPARYQPTQVVRPAPAPGAVERVVERLMAAKAPVIVAGRGVLQAGAAADLHRLAERLGVPVMTTLTGKSSFDEGHPLALGAGGLSRTGMVDHFLAAADLVVGIGTPFTRSHYITAMPDGVPLIQIADSELDIANSYPIDTAIIADIGLALAALVQAAEAARPDGPPDTTPLAAEIARVKAAFIARWADRLNADAEPISPYRLVLELGRALDRSASCVTHDSGNPRDQIVPFFQAAVSHGYLGWGKTTPLGSGLGLIMGAKLARPDWTCVNIMGDAAIGMTGMDLETAVRCNIPTLTVVLNNGLMGGYTYWQPVATERYKIQYLGGDYTALASSFGLHAERVETIAALNPALTRAIAATRDGTPALVEVMTREEPILAVPERHA